MPSKKMGKKMEKGGSYGYSGASYHKVIGWILIILGLLGVLQAANYAPLPPIFAWVWALFVLIIGLKKVFWSEWSK